MLDGRLTFVSVIVVRARASRVEGDLP